MYGVQLKLVPNHFGALQNLGLLRAQQGQLDEAIKLIRRALKQNPKSAEAHNNLGNVLHQTRRYTDADNSFKRAVALKPDYARAYNNRGATLQALGEFEEAVRCCETAISIAPDYSDAHHNLGNALRSLGRQEEAVAHFNRALDKPPIRAGTHRDLANTLQDLGRYREAVHHYLAALAITDGDAEIYYNLATALLMLNRHQEASANYQRALELKPDHAESFNNLGAIKLELNRADEAIIYLDKAVALTPDNAESHSNRGQALLALGRADEAVLAFERALEIRPGHAAAHNNLGTVLREKGRHEEAIAHFEAALKTQAEHPHAAFNLDGALAETGREARASSATKRIGQGETSFQLGNLFAELGRNDAALRALENAVDLDAARPLYYLALSEVKRFTLDDRHFIGMRSLASGIDDLPEREQMFLRFALAKALADVGQHDESFRQLLLANSIKRRDFTYNESEALSNIDQIAKVFTPEVMQSLASVGDESCLPIFIVGMPRSGTTLIEQILASHPRVFGAGELELFSNLVTAASNAPTIERVRALGSRYLAGLRALGPPADRITDKMPSNFLYVGLIHLALPNARIIHARRNPIDTCLSCFSKLFAGEQPFAYDLEELGRYYCAYDRLMAHWRAVLPEGVMLEIDYEGVVADLEGQARRIIAHCGLDWNDGCLEFYKTDRAVRTASVNQVRQPIYQSSVSRWQRYGHLITPLLQALEQDAGTGCLTSNV
jgi:tetratricopeptide (TPR) repeat protein